MILSKHQRERVRKQMREDEQTRYSTYFEYLLRFDPAFAEQHAAQGDAWMRDHYNTAHLHRLLQRFQNQLPNRDYLRSNEAP